MIYVYITLLIRLVNLLLYKDDAECREIYVISCEITARFLESSSSDIYHLE